jgi:signal transduction histidine kinase
MGALRSRPAAADLVVAAVFVVTTTTETLWRAWGRPAWLVLGLTGLVPMLVLIYRRRFPLAALTVYVVAGAVATVVQSRLPDPTERTTSAFVPIIALLVLCYSVAAHGNRRAVLLGAPQPVLLVALIDLLQPDAGSLAVGLPFIALIVVGLPMLAGWLVRSRATLLTELEQTDRALAEEHQQRLRTVRARESLALAQRLATELESGLLSLHELSKQHEPTPRAEIAQLEARARSLLTHTRHTVVTLTNDDDGVESPSGGRSLRPVVRIGREDGAVGWTVLVAAATGIAMVLESHAKWGNAPLALVLCGTVVAALACLSWRPLECLILAWAGTALFVHLVAPLDRDGNLVVSGLVVTGAFLVASLAARARALAGLLVSVLGSALVLSAADLPGTVVLGCLAWLGGRILRGRIHLLRQVRGAQAALNRVRADELRTSKLEERAAVSRDVHDAIGHGLTVVALQAGAALRLVDQDPAACAAALATIERVTGQALDELHRGFGTTGDVGTLVSDARAAGVCVTVTGTIEPRGEQGQVLHRIVQEALTNAIRHAPGADVTVCCDEDDSGMTVSNGPAARTPELPGGGRGLTGMRDRLATAGGTLDWRHSHDGGFVLHAWLPRPTRNPAAKPHQEANA